MISFLISEIADNYIKENFLRLKRYFKEQPLLRGEWRFIELDISSAVTNYQYKHGLNFIPKDVIQTSLIGSGNLTWNYSNFNREYIDITTTGPCTVRAFIGSFIEDSNI